MAELATKISKRNKLQLKYSTRVRRVKGLLTLYSVFVYTIYTAIVLVGHRYQRSRWHIAGLAGGPLTLWLVRWMIQRWYSWWSSFNDDQLETLHSQRKEMIEELKEKSNFYSTQALLSRFDSQKSVEEEKQDEQEELAAQEEREAAEQQSAAAAAAAAQMQMSPSPDSQFPLIPVGSAYYQPKWYDRILDLIAGEDENSPKMRYALICKRCAAHNGLAQPGETPDEVVYICPHCGFKNGEKKIVVEGVAERNKKDDKEEGNPENSEPSASSTSTD